MSSRRLCCRLETPDKQQQRDCGQCQPRNDTEAIHEGQEIHLTLKLLVQIPLRSDSGVRTGEALRNEIVRQRGYPVA
jgi:hypothetical protein